MTDNNLLLISNAKIWVSGLPDFNWMIINVKTGYVVDIGRNSCPTSTLFLNHIDINGRRIFPGFHDSHIHVSLYGELLNNLNLVECKSIDKFKQAIFDYVAEFPNKVNIIGRGWDDNLLGRLPTKEDIDQVCNDRPVVLSRICCHAGVANSKALNLFGMSNSCEDPCFDRYPPDHPRSGEFTGVLKEGAYEKVHEYFSKSYEDIEQNIKTGLQECLRRGLTSVHSNEPTQAWIIYKNLALSNQLPIRVFFAGYFHGRDVNNFPRAREKHGDKLYCDRTKLFVDGALGVRTAALSVPYKCSCTKGMLIHTRDQLNELVKEATSSGFRLEIHVIGDEAAEVALDAIEYAQVTAEKRTLLTHCQILREDLIVRMKATGVIANIQPSFVASDGSWVDNTLPINLLPYAYAWKSLLDKGIRCAGGSDAPIESCDPLLGIYNAIFRRTRSSNETKYVFRPEECLSIKQAVDLYTKDGAYATMAEDHLGQLLPGYLADFVVIDSAGDVCQNPEEFAKASIAETWIGGIKMYKRE